MKALKAVVTLLTSIVISGSAIAEPEPKERQDPPRVEIEEGECIGLLGRAGKPGKFETCSDEIKLSEKVAQCNLCLHLGEKEATCLDDETRLPFLEEKLNGGLKDGMVSTPAKRHGAKIEFTLKDEQKESYVCHFHSYESGEIDCH